MLYEFDPVTHIGKVNGVEWPSVTQLLHEEKMIDYSAVPEDRLEYKRLIGTRFAGATVLVDDQNFDEEHAKQHFPEVLPYLEGYKKFREFGQFEPIIKEHRLFSSKWMFHGAPDEIAINTVTGRLAIVEYKCTWVMYPATGPQTFGYEILLREHYKELGIKPELIKKGIERHGILFRENETFSDPVLFNDSNEKQDFLGAVWMHWRRRNKYKTEKGVRREQY